MEHCKISKSLSDSTVSKFVTKKWIEVNNLSGSQYSSNKTIRRKVPMLASDLYDYSDAYIIAWGRISVTSTNAAYRKNKSYPLKIMLVL